MLSDLVAAVGEATDRQTVAHQSDCSDGHDVAMKSLKHGKCCVRVRACIVFTLHKLHEDAQKGLILCVCVCVCVCACLFACRYVCVHFTRVARVD